MNERELKIEEFLSRGVSEAIDRDHIKERLMCGDALRVKLGIDPTSPNIHIGRAITLLKLRDLQEFGCKLVLIVGDFTGQIGDTSDKESERPMLAPEHIEENMRTYTEQIGKLIDLSQAEIHYNSTWLEKLGFDAIGEQADHFSVAEFISRDNIRKRLDAGKRVSLREMLYPLMQGYDSVAVNADIEIGGTDQRFNLLAGRKLQEAHGQPVQDILMVNLIPGTDGRKMSSSWGNTINVLDVPNEMFGKIMSIPDELIVSYFIHCTRVALSEIEVIEAKIGSDLNPRDAKLRLAKEIVRIYHGDEEGEKAEIYFIQAFSKKEIPDDIPEFSPEYDAMLGEYENLESFIIRRGFAKSKSDARRKIEQGGVSLGNEKIKESRPMKKDTDDGKVLKVGKKDFVKIVF